MSAPAPKKKDRKGLGRGLDALMGAAPIREEIPAPKPEAGPRRELPIEFLKPNPDQPRRVFDKDAIEELAQSIKARGLLQPILVRPVAEKEFQIVAGERRWRAAQRAGLHNVPVVIRELTDEETAEIALIENVQRVDLNPIEEALAYRRLSDAFGRTQEEIAKAVGKSRSHVANAMRLLALPDRAVDALAAGKISAGHARALLGADDPTRACELVLKNDLSVRETEALVKDFSKEKRQFAHGTPDKSDRKKPAGPKDADTRALEADLAAILGLEVRIEHRKGGAGSVTVDYSDLDQLDDLCRRLMGSGA